MEKYFHVNRARRTCVMAYPNLVTKSQRGEKWQIAKLLSLQRTSHFSEPQWTLLSARRVTLHLRNPHNPAARPYN